MVRDADGYFVPFLRIKVIRSTTQTLPVQDRGETLVVMGAST
jgi:hypothetical protein